MTYLQTASCEDTLSLLPRLSPRVHEPDLQDSPCLSGRMASLCHLLQGALPETRECQPHSFLSPGRQAEASHAGTSRVWKVRVPVLALLILSPFPTSPEAARVP